ncbi:MAG: DEAD/DEAH box helicase [Pseudomonadota bacterium]
MQTIAHQLTAWPRVLASMFDAGSAPTYARPGLKLGQHPARAEERSPLELGYRWLDQLRRPVSLATFDALYCEAEDHAVALAALNSAEVRRRARSAQDAPMPERIALLSEVSHRALDLRPHKVQLFAAWALMHGRMTEMATGEGKTLTAALAAAAIAASGTPVHIITINDYLVQRDARDMMPLFQWFGVSVGAVTSSAQDEERRAAHAARVVYCTNKQLVFDYLRDRQLPTRGRLSRDLGELLDVSQQEPMVQGLCFAIIDEADSVLIDEARTPLVLARERARDRVAGTQASVAMSVAAVLHEGADFLIDDEIDHVRITEDGAEAVVTLTRNLGGVWDMPRYREAMISQALYARHLLLRDRHYIVRDGELLLIDESTGRVLTDRKLQHGLHSMLEIKEGCEPKPETEVIAALSFQRFFPRFHHLAAMTGTGWEVRREIARLFGMTTVRVPPNRPSRVEHLGTDVVADVLAISGRCAAIARECRGNGQPLLIGTRSLELSERISRELVRENIDHELLNARQDASEARIVARAGAPGSVTVATNMAGRGTDIPVSSAAAENGGLLVLSVELNDSLRVDRQLFGRTARQGRPGSVRCLWSLDDPLFDGSGSQALRAWLAPRLHTAYGQWLSRALIRLRKWQIERMHGRQRKALQKQQDTQDRLLAFSGNGD